MSHRPTYPWGFCRIHSCWHMCLDLCPTVSSHSNKGEAIPLHVYPSFPSTVASELRQTLIMIVKKYPRHLIISYENTCYTLLNQKLLYSSPNHLHVDKMLNKINFLPFHFSHFSNSLFIFSKDLHNMSMLLYFPLESLK